MTQKQIHRNLLDATELLLRRFEAMVQRHGAVADYRFIAHAQRAIKASDEFLKCEQRKAQRKAA